VLFEIQLDPEANAMAGTRPRTREVFDALWDRTLSDPAGGSARVIELGSEIVGSIARFQAEGNDCVGYWIARPHWGRGIASRTLDLFLQQEPVRPLHATAAAANTASRRILEKSGFAFLGLRMGEATDRFIACQIADYVLK
jgi:RimJ/RimL family protein N-acetyltransferase